MSSVTIEVLGDPKLAAVIGNLESLEAISIATVALAKKLVPVDEGELRNTIMYVAPNSEGGFNESAGKKADPSEKLSLKPNKNSAIVGTGSNHWYPEFGTYKMIAQPFIRPALLAVVRNGSAAAIVKKFGTEAMKKEFKGRAGKKRGFRII